MRFFHCFFLLSLSLSLPGLESGQNPLSLASGPNEAQALMPHCKNSVRDTAIVRGGLVQIQREAHSTGCGPSIEPWNVVWLASPPPTAG